MLVYCFDYRTREFVGACELGPTDVDPRNPDAFLVPGNAVADPPPALEDKQAAVWGGAAWSIVPDHRGEIWWDQGGRPVVIEELGDPSALGLSPDAPPPPIPEITRRQLRLWMLNAGHDDAAIRAAIATLDEPDRSHALIEYEDATTFQRSHHLFDLLGPAFGLASADIDQAFREAALL